MILHSKDVTQFNRRNAMVATGLIILISAVLRGLHLPVGTLAQWDEFLTLDRAHSFTIREDMWTVYSQNLPSFKKPPLQYWMGATFLNWELDLEVAMRLPSFLFSTGLAVVTAWLTALVYPRTPWAMPAVVFLLLCSERFWQSSLSAMLDMGTTFAAIGAIAGILATRRTPVWWYAVAAFCVFGALQKAPIALGFAVLTVFILWLHSLISDQKNCLPRFGRHFGVALLVTIAGVLFWPILQWLRFGEASIEEAYVSQMVERFSPFSDKASLQRSFFSLVTDGEQGFRIFAIGALFWLPFAYRRGETWILTVPFAIYCVAIILANGLVSPRYSMLFVPAMIIALIVVIFTYVQKPRIRLALVILCGALAQGPYKTPDQLGIIAAKNARFVPIASEIGEAILPEETLIICAWAGRKLRINPGLLSYYASDGRPFYRLRSSDAFIALLENTQIKGPYRGLCTEDQISEIGAYLVGVQKLSIDRKYVHWTATGLSKP